MKTNEPDMMPRSARASSTASIPVRDTEPQQMST
jgi:hypothetical protein